jgi:Flp pilus assembly protein protease CpaA
MYVLSYVFLCGGNGLDGLSLKLVGFMIVMSCLLVTSWVDFKHQIIPDSMWIAIFIGGLFIVGDKLIDHSFTKDWLISRIIGLFSVSGVFLIIGLVTGGRAMGGGDIKLMAAVGFVLGWKAVLIALFMSALFGVLSQRLVRKICTSCNGTGKDAEGQKCRRCNGTGYKGRSGIFELLFMNDELRQAVNRNASSSELESIAEKHGMVTLKQDGKAKVEAGITTEEELNRSTANL